MPLKMITGEVPGEQGFSFAFLALMFGFVPILPSLIASLIASTYGCILHEGNQTVCVVFGSDIGGYLHTAFVSGWIGILTVLPGFIIGAGAVFFEWSQNRKHQHQPSKTHIIARYFVLIIIGLFLLNLLAPLFFDSFDYRG